MIGYENESSAYFELKLTAHNFTFYNMVTQDAMAFWFDETQATFGASMFASCLCSYTTELLDQSLNTVILYSDGCGYQNRNAIFSNELLHISVTRKVTSVQKFLEKGHTQMECDSVHSTIERRYEHDDVYLPNQYVLHSISARRVPMPYRAKLLGFSFFEDFSQAASMLYSFIRAGTCVNCSTNLWETVSLLESEQGSPNPESVTECEPVASTSTSSSHENLATSAKHKSLPEVVAATSAYQKGGEKRGKLSDGILFMICRDDQPISIVDEEGFRYPMKVSSPLYTVHSRRTIDSTLDDKYQRWSNKILLKLIISV